MSFDYDLIVIGAGSGGVRAARMAATYGAKVAVVEEFRVGGTCVIRGCVPKKLYVYASRFRDEFELAESFGWQVDASFDWPTLVAAKEKEITRLEIAYATNLAKPGAEIIRDRAVVTGPNSVKLLKGDRELTTKYILVATGATPFIPDVPGRELGISSNEAFDLPELPKSILIEGGGYIAVEFATIFAGLGVDTTLVYRRDRLLRTFDKDMSDGLEFGLKARGIALRYNDGVAGLAKSADGVTVTFKSGDSASYSQVMFATGRTPNTDGLGLETAGVVLDGQKNIVVDAFSKTNVPSVYAVGDVTGRAQLTPVAIREGWYFAETLFNNNPLTVDHSLIPTAVFSEPEIGTVGLTEDEAVAQSGDVDVYLARFRPMANTLSDRQERVVIKLITEKDEGKVLGVHLLGPSSGEMIQMVAIAVGMGATKKDLDRTIALHPSAAEELVTFKSPSYSYRNGTKV
ncbi:glutathione-disulfide reductase [Devosia sp. MC521]|uniref:glutathione-disulfide reductase n=1 Tax=Devosia sp. MC521 TaxID=2759954 RepID=UPI0015F8F848|nr:glutathione-disulfide reductase [Devosia sp. MC521]MBJ6987347.1 glutathione-disulfide reductase [Devosia sp. MC521]QMW63523.1 glutathione-disulfide reductase [Devosia sp. MC521]